MRRILVVLNRSLEIGGIEMALISFLNVLSEDKNNEVTLMIGDDKGELMDKLPKSVKLLIDPYNDVKTQFVNDIKCIRIIKVIRGVFYRLLTRFSKGRELQLLYGYKAIEPYIHVEGCYDCAIAYASRYSELSIVMNVVDATKKIVFIHANPFFSRGMTDYFTKDLYKKFDCIFCVSEDIRNMFIEKYKTDVEWTRVFYNYIDVKDVTNKADEIQCFFESGYINILTVGRLSPIKGQDRILKVMANLTKDYNNIRWYILGGGKLDLYEKEIESLSLQNKVFMLGEIQNPYPYIRMCDIYVQPSRSEALCTTITEAKIFARPIVACDFPGIREQIQNGINGSIVENSVNGIYEGLRELLSNSSKREQYIAELRKNPKINNTDIGCLYKVID